MNFDENPKNFNITYEIIGIQLQIYINSYELSKLNIMLDVVWQTTVSSGNLVYDPHVNSIAHHAPTTALFL